MRPTIAEIDLSAIVHNYLLAKQYSGNTNALAVVKADAYGHGVVEVVKTLALVADGFAVATVEEAIEVRQALLSFAKNNAMVNDVGVDESGKQAIIKRLTFLPIIVLSSFSCQSECHDISHYNLTVVIYNQQQLSLLANAHKAQRLVKPQAVWLKLDSGMGRWGIDFSTLNDSEGSNETSAEIILQQLASLCKNGMVSLQAIMTHFACADEKNNPFTLEQYDQFNKQFALIKAKLPNQNFSISLQNSAAIVHWPEIKSDWARPGIMLYGSLASDPDNHSKLGLLPAMTLKTKVLDIKSIKKGQCVGYAKHFVTQKDSVIAYLPCGYADGYPRNIQKNTPVLINGTRVPIVGRVSMDAMAVDITDIYHNVIIGDEAVLWGKGLPVDDLEVCTNSISYELLSCLGARVPRVYINERENF